MQIAVAMIKCHETNPEILYVKVHEVAECEEDGVAGEMIDYLKTRL